MDTEIQSKQAISDGSENPVNNVQQGTSECLSSPVNGLQEGTSESPLKQAGQVESGTIISVGLMEAGTVNCEDGDSESKGNVPEIMKVSVNEQKFNVSEPERHNFTIDVKCTDGALSSKNWDGEKVCRICHLSSDCSSATLSLNHLGCGCKDELGIAHGHCAEAWFKVKGNRYCEICGQEAKNITGLGGNRFMEEWKEIRMAGNGSRSSDRGGGCWKSQTFCNFLMVCLVMAFVLPWFLRIDLF